MSQLKVSICIIFLFVYSIGISQNIKKANKLLIKGEIDRFQETLQKTLEKDSLNPGIDFLYASLYIMDSYENHNIDKAKKYIQNSSEKYKSIDEKKLSELEEININQFFIDSLNVVIDSLGYDIAAKKNSVDSYEHYMKNYPNSKNWNLAYDKRNTIVYESIKKLNTWRAYQYFIQSYKGAKQIQDAKAKYERLLYEEKTKDKTLGSYRLFLSQNKNTPYRDEIEKNILKISTQSNDPKEYINFVKSYPNSKWLIHALEYLYYVSNKEITEYEQYFKNAGIYDSLNNLKRLESIPLLPYYENKKYGFINLNGKTIIESSFRSIKKEYLCQIIRDDFLVVGDKLEKVILNRNLDTLYKGNFFDVEDIGGGILKIIKKNEMQLIHKSGKKIYSDKLENAYVIYKKFILIEKGDKYELISFYGSKLFEISFDDVMHEGEFIIFEKNGKYAISNYQNLSKIVRNSKEKLKFIYDEFELINEKFLLCFANDEEELIDDNLNTIISKSKQNIYPINKGWIIKNDSGYQILSHVFDFKFSTLFEKIQTNNKYISGKKEDKWDVFSIINGEKILENYDSIKLLTDSVIWVKNENQEKLFFSNNKQIAIDTSSVINILQTNQESKDFRKYIRVSDNKEAHIYSETGEKLPKMEFFHIVKRGDTFNKISAQYNMKPSEVLSMNNKKNTTILVNEKIKIRGYTPKKLVTDDLFEIEEANKKGLVDKYGKLTLEKIYDGIRLIDDNTISILKNQKFGVYNTQTRKIIDPAYDSELIAYDSGYF